MNIHLIDGTYELYRHFYAVPSQRDPQGIEIAAVRGVLASVLSLLEAGASHIGVATDHVIESFRNQLYPGYKTGDGIDPLLYAQFPLLEQALSAMGVTVWPMTDFEADDALASAAARAAADPRVSKVLICSPDKDLAQCIVDTRIVQWDRQRNLIRNAAGVREKWGIDPHSIPDYLALVGDSADGFPGLPGWGAKAASSILSVYPHLEDIPANPRLWTPSVRGADRLSTTLREQWDNALLYRTLATLRTDAPVQLDSNDLRWHGPQPNFPGWTARLQSPNLLTRAQALLQRLHQHPAATPPPAAAS